MKLLLGSVPTLLLVATSAVAEVVRDGAAASDENAVPVAYAVEPLPAMVSNNAHAFPAVPMMSSNRADVLQIISGMRAQLADHDSLALDNGISQLADAFVDHWDLAVEANVAWESEALQAMVAELYNPNSFLIQDFLQAPTISVGESLFLQPEFTSPIPETPQVGFFAQ